MINSANARSISDLYNTEKDIIYFIPKYQREYVWNKNNWEALFDDIWDNDENHFLGSIICINKKTDSIENDRLELIDGQQRMTTLFLFFLAIQQHMSKLKDSIEDEEELLEFNSELLNLKYKLILKSDKKSIRLEPSYAARNKEDFEHLLSHETNFLKGRFKWSDNAGNRRILKAYRYFSNRLAEYKLKPKDADEDYKDEYVYDVEMTKQLLKKINSAILVKIEVSNHSDAFTLFETLNTRGVPLSPIDIIKNAFLNESEKRQKDSIDANFEKWTLLNNNLLDDYKIQDRFLRHFYNAYKNEKSVEVRGKTRATRSNLILIYDTLIKKDPNTFFNKLYKSSETYNKLIIPNHEENSKEITSTLKDLQNIGGATSYQLLMYVFENFDLDDESKIELIEYLVKFFLRRSITDLPPTRDLDKIFIEIIKEFHESKDYNLNKIKHHIQMESSYATDELFFEKLKGDLYEENTGATRFILCKVEELNNKTRETYTDLWARDDKNRFIWTIEHIFPQGNNIPQDWINMIGDGDKKRAKKIQEECVHTLGNLTLTGYNSQLSNLSFVKKRDRTNKNGSYVGYRNGMFLNEDLKDKSNWLKNDIDSRGDKIIDLIKQYID
ncbi:Protein of unknown function [Hyunsoonleella jejuensis]|uniref:DUF262 domain-containing protein n=1 Tax=Hyunsoonleella jejuensis TaxID=419940 RepID=A0A1H9CQV3_9FLAO|nr:DUF262 domain-containing protein [Hyunsoonleella jejuensis]SEQ02988.1 Protein of unknown function [Hyunsoonleella jejuensis]